LLSDHHPHTTPETERWLEDHGDALFRYALVRVRNRETAEDLVQDTLLAALRARDRFAGRSSVGTWLTGILKNKIIDHYRKQGRQTTFTDLSFFRDECADQFDGEGFWDHDHGLGPKEWRPPSDEVLHRAEFWQVLRACLDKLPPRVAQVFTLRVVDDLTSKEVCEVTRVSESNLWVMLHRARMALRECFERNWFEQPTK
jgi:RNA polymerase sigma-70 factor (ECF subfamily)